MGSLEHALVALPLDGLIGWEGAKIKDLSHFEWNLIKKNFSYNPHEFRWGNCDFNELIFFEDDLEMLTFELKNELLQA